MNLPTLFKKSSTGALQEWTVSTEENVIVVRWGVIGGKIQETRDLVSSGKNVGKKNETTPTQQAEAEALSLWEKKKKKGYVEDPEAAMAGQTDTLIEGGVFPMLAHRFDKHGHKIEYPAFAQPKLDGHRCIVVVKDGRVSMWSRTRKPIKSLPHIIDHFERIIEGDTILDGELYNHTYKSRFEELTSFIRQQNKPKDGHEVVEYHVYDLVHGADFEHRLEALEEFFHFLPSDLPIKKVPTFDAPNEERVTELFQEFLDMGYEGLMLRNARGGYLHKRSYDLQKVKEFDDDEFIVVGVEEGRGKMAGHAMFVMTTPSGVEFSAKMKGELSELQKYIVNPSLAIGKTVTVQYQGLTEANKVPRFPVVLRFREGK